MSMHFHVPAEKVPVPGMRVFLMLGGQSIALFNIDSKFYAINDSCPHQGASLWSGKLEGRVIQCCAHGMRFDLDSGYLLNSTQLQLTTYPVELADEQIYILMDTEE